ncbi:predicted protein [Arabidopsis lyrata subsp. lyrata]|uniref:Predicted protein n=1 Tax=Arabidopsis lyrata subsp. lyrata TaxID=81972 RepID=D7M6Y0_ARALL|nr:predicted protein [Arabidopsis lyrata subsp. lyrata]
MSVYGWRKKVIQIGDNKLTSSCLRATEAQAFFLRTEETDFACHSTELTRADEHLFQLTYRLSRCCYCSEEKDKGQKKETEEYAKVKREKRVIRGYSTRWGRVKASL